MVRDPQAAGSTASKPNAKWLEPTVKVRILHRGGLTAERVRRPVFEALIDEGHSQS